jgi:hypothetical protein
MRRYKISWNELWTGTTVVREVKKEGDRLIYTTKPAPFSRDGKVSITKVVREKLRYPSRRRLPARSSAT